MKNIILTIIFAVPVFCLFYFFWGIKGFDYKNTLSEFNLGDSFYIQLQGKINLDKNVDIYDIDLFDTPVDTIELLQSKGKKVICYFSAGTSEDWRDDYNLFPKKVLGNKLENWEGERRLDISNYESFSGIIKDRLDIAKIKGCDAVDPDNVDGYTNNTGFPLTYKDQLEYNKFLSKESHKRGLKIGLKNNLKQIKDLVNYFDFAVNEQCFQYNECDYLNLFIKENKPVFGIEYELSKKEFCDKAKENDFFFVKANYDLKGNIDFCSNL